MTERPPHDDATCPSCVEYMGWQTVPPTPVPGWYRSGRRRGRNDPAGEARLSEEEFWDREVPRRATVETHYMYAHGRRRQRGGGWTDPVQDTARGPEV